MRKDIKELERDIKKLINKTQEGLTTSFDVLAAEGARFAALRAPRDTGALVQGIHFKHAKKRSGAGEIWILQRNPGLKNPNVWGEPFNYAAWMARTGGQPSKANFPREGHSDKGTQYRFVPPFTWSGDPYYMQATARYLRMRTPLTVRAHVQRIIKS